jgi:hypothetical protein
MGAIEFKKLLLSPNISYSIRGQCISNATRPRIYIHIAERFTSGSKEKSLTGW